MLATQWLDFHGALDWYPMYPTKSYAAHGLLHAVIPEIGISGASVCAIPIVVQVQERKLFTMKGRIFQRVG